jgi:exopolysaccharide production protein ExoQ
MPPVVALLLWIVLLLALLYFDPAKIPGTSVALWVPVAWIFFLGTRLPSQWLGNQLGVSTEVLEEGNPLDRAVFSVLILLAVGILAARSLNWGAFFARNIVLMLFLAFAFVSFCWSDFPLVSLKRWFRDLGNYLMILVVLSDPRPAEAAGTLLRRLSYLLLPLSVLLIKYYPYMAKTYGTWNGISEFIGAATSKNMLGNTCLISGMFFFWDTATRWAGRAKRGTKRIILLNIAFMSMALWLLHLSASATSGVCLAIGCFVIVAVRSNWGTRHRNFVKIAIPATFCLYIILGFGFELNGQLASQIGRDPTLTDRTRIWNAVLGQHTNPLVGTGYESFWLGPRLGRVGELAGYVNEAHNGYLEIYLNLGAIGLFLIGGLLVTSYRNICKDLAASSALASFSMAMWAVMLFYNVTEAAFKVGLLWPIFLLSAIVIPERAEDRVPHFAFTKSPNATERIAGSSFHTAGSRRVSRASYSKH